MSSFDASVVGQLIQANRGARRIVIDGNAAAPTYWVTSGDKPDQAVSDSATVSALLDAIKKGFGPDEEVSLTSAGLVTQQFAIDGIGQITVWYGRGASPSAVITIEPPKPGGLKDFEVPDRLRDVLIERPVGMVLVGGDRATASEFARSLFIEVADSRVELAAAVIADRPLARSVVRTPLLWLRRNARTGITRIGDAAAYAESFAKIVLIDISGDAGGLVPSSLLLADAGALVIVVAPGNTTHKLLERWRVGAPSIGAEGTWTATVSHLRSVITAETIYAKFGPERVCEWILAEETNVTNTLATQGPEGVGMILSSRLGGSESREVRIGYLRGKDRL